jgi:hypothetical protein
MSASDWNGSKTLAKLDELVSHGVIGFYKSFEITEIFAVLGKEHTNVLTVAVGEPTQAPAEVNWKSVLLNAGERFAVPRTKVSIGVVQYRLAVPAFIGVVDQFTKTEVWKPSPVQLKVGHLNAVAPQFVPADSRERHPWNGVLKNNFFEGSHVLELFDTTKQHVRFLLDDSRRLSEVAQFVGRYLPMRIDGMSDRLGNVIIQLPVTVLSVARRAHPDGDNSVAVAWHPLAEPRGLRVASEKWGDSTIASFDAALITSGEARLQLNSPGGGARTNIWDDERRILLSATAPLSYFTSGNVSVRAEVVHGDSVQQREFFIRDSHGQLTREVITLLPGEKEVEASSVADLPKAMWIEQRVFGESVVSLKERKEFVQYGLEVPPPMAAASTKEGGTNGVDADADPDDSLPEAISQTEARRSAALADLHWLMRRHGAEGVWLWDPFLTADDIMRTLFYCPHRGVPLRALSAGKKPPGRKVRVDAQLPAQEQQKIARQQAVKDRRLQHDHLEAAKGNANGLKLEFRMRVGQDGWAFHDRFIIFPRSVGSALAWSLGTSINSFGVEHHILQRVLHGEPIANAFDDLWSQLQDSKHFIWASSIDEREQQ